jgi:hypothetical protein
MVSIERIAAPTVHQAVLTRYTASTDGGTIKGPTQKEAEEKEATAIADSHIPMVF